MQTRIYFFSLMMLAAACSAPPPSSAPAPEPQAEVKPEPVPEPAPPPKPKLVQPSGPWIEWPIAPGNWIYRQDARGSIALFGLAGADALITVRCDNARGRIYLTRADQTGGAASTMTLRSSSAMKQFNAGKTGAAPAYVAAEIMPTDSILDAMAYTRGRIAIETAGQQSVAVPVWSELPRVIGDCR